MPIRPENRKRYPMDWDEISYRIRYHRANGRCECTGECGLHQGRRCCEQDGKPATWARGTVVLTTAHLDHQPENCDDKNLRAMCQRCHLVYDRDHHAASRERATDERLGQMKLGFTDTGP